MIDFLKLPSPCYVLDETLLDRNLAVIDRVRRESGAEIIVALKACAMWSIFPELARHSDGATASSAAEARLVFEEYGKPAHTYAPVYTDRNIDEILRCSDHITFNSVAQFGRFGPMALLRLQRSAHCFRRSPCISSGQRYHTLQYGASHKYGSGSQKAVPSDQSA